MSVLVCNDQTKQNLSVASQVESTFCFLLSGHQGLFITGSELRVMFTGTLNNHKNKVLTL